MASNDMHHLLKGLPPAPVLWLTSALDTVCYPLQCSDWRDTMGIAQDSWLAVQVPPLAPHLPRLLTYPDFVKQQSSSSYGSVQSLYQYAFETESTSLGNLGTPTSALVLLVLVLLIRTVKSILLPTFSKLGRQAGRRTHGPDWEAANQVRIVKFGEYVFRLLYHAAISLYGVTYFWDKEWWKSGGTLSLFQGFPNHAVQPGMAWYYLLQAAYNLDAFVSLLELSFCVTLQSPFAKKTTTKKEQQQWPVRIAWRETVRGDFQEMFVHHVVTNVLVIGSSFCRLTRTGSMVFLVHDLSDVPVDLSKLANFLKWKAATAICFFIMVLVWMITRLYILPVTIYGAILTQSQHVLESGVLPPVLYACYRPFFYVGVAFLILLHAAWFAMFIRMGYLLVFKNETHDLSEFKKGEEQQIHGKSSTAVPATTTKTTITAATNGGKTRSRRYAGDEKKDD